MLCGAALPHLKKKSTESLEVATSQNTADVGLTDSWSALQDQSLQHFAKHIFLHVTRVLHVLMHVIEETNPLANVKVSQVGALLCYHFNKMSNGRKIICVKISPCN